MQTPFARRHGIYGCSFRLRPRDCRIDAAGQTGVVMKANNFSVQRLMDDVISGRLVLPDFQRNFVWKPDDVKDLLVSILGKFYVGSMLYMDEPRDEAPFELKFVEGVRQVKPQATIDSYVKILLDGQQRTSSLFYALYAPELPLAGRKSPFAFFLNLQATLQQDWEKSVVFVLKTNKKQMQAVEEDDNCIPFTAFHDIGKLLQHLQTTKFSERAAEIITAVNDFMKYDVQTIELPRGTSLERVVETFERINRTGEPLSVSDLLVAKLYREKIKLRELIEDAKSKVAALDYVDSDYLLKIICLLRDKEVRRKDVLSLEATGFEAEWHEAVTALDTAYRRTTDTKAGYGAFDLGRLMPFKTMLVPLAAAIALMKRKKCETDKNYSKIDRWYWTTVFANRYNEAVNTNTYSDYRALKEWLDDDAKAPPSMKDFSVEHIDLGADSKTSTIYKAVMCLIVLEGALDFKTGQPPHFAPNQVEDDHIFPKSKYFDDSVLNRTLISTNQQKAAQQPGVFFAALENINGRDEMLNIMRTHLIDEQGFEALLKNDTAAFLRSREAKIRSKVTSKVAIPV